MELPAVLRLAPGTGLVARRPTSLLFTARRDAALVAAFTTSPHGAELQAVASATVATGFDVAAFVCLAWTSGIQVMAFGDLAVETDQPSLPMLSGTGSRTWVEHSLPSADRAVVAVAAAGGEPVDDATDLADGIAPAGGFRLELGTEPRPAASPAATPPAEPVSEAVSEPVSEVVVSEPVSDDSATRAIPRRAPDDPAAALAMIQAAAVGPDGEPLASPVQPTSPTVSPEPEPDPAASPETASEPLEAHDADITLPPPVSGDLLAEIADHSRGALVEAKLCGKGHPNPPTVASCGVCGEFLAPGHASVVHVPRPSLGRLRLDDGEVIELDHELLIGRNPDRDQHPERVTLTRLKLHGDKVSRTHLEVRFQGWDVLIADCGSTNGTFVVSHPGGQVTALEAGRPQLVEPGATVYFGSRSFTVLGRQS